MDTAGKFFRILEVTSVIFAFILALNPSDVNTATGNSLAWIATRTTFVYTQVTACQDLKANTFPDAFCAFNSPPPLEMEKNLTREMFDKILHSSLLFMCKGGQGTPFFN